MTPEESRKWHNDKYQKWRSRAIPRLQALGPRVAVLDHRFYAGCGFHYSMKQKYENLLKYLDEELIVTEDHPENAISHQIVNEVILEELCRDVALAEKSADELEKQHGQESNQATD